jgi:general stress protein YciG
MNSEAMPKAKRQGRGFQLMAPARLQEVSSMGGKRSQQLGTAHRMTKDEAKRAGKLGGLASAAARRARAAEREK